MRNLFYVKCIAVFLIGSFLSYLSFKTQALHYDNTQILDRVFTYFFENQWIHFGNAATGVGFVPGSLITFINVVAMKMFFSAYSMMAMIWIFHTIALILILHLLKPINKFLILDFLILFWLNPWRIDQTILYNPSYIFLFSAMHLYSAIKMSEKNMCHTFIHFLSIGFCAQVHLSFVILVFLSVILWFFKFIKISWSGFFLALVAILASLYPWMMAVLFDPPFRQADFEVKKSFLFKNTILIFPIFKSILYWIRYSTTYFSSNIFMDLSLEWLDGTALKYLVKYPFIFLKYVFAIISLYFSTKIHWKNFLEYGPYLLKRKDKYNLSLKSRLMIYSCYMFFSAILATMISPIEFNHWHLIITFPISLLVVSLFFNQLRQSKPKTHAFGCLAITVFFISYNLLTSIDSRSHKLENDYSKAVIEYFNSKIK